MKAATIIPFPGQFIFTVPHLANPTIWIADDDPDLRRLLDYVLSREGYTVETFAGRDDLFGAADRSRPDVLLLDVYLGDHDGLELCRQLRQRPGFFDVVIAVMTASQDTLTRYRGFDVGCDDYLVKPIDNVELLLRLRNRLVRKEQLAGTGRPTCGPDHGLRDHALRDHGGPLAGQLAFGKLVLDFARREVEIAGRRESLTASEFAVLRYLLERPGTPVDVETLLVAALGYPPGLGNPDIIRTHVRNLRAKIEQDPHEPAILLNKPGLGYLIERTTDRLRAEA